ncbi:hypothetical protein NPS70_16395 [Streptomyces sp. C10-9-1]|uniref:hypothetical protein n=1 Tax=Streptomyces sp. C10-9-1 TaxID=1859285 RepID=UPI00211296D8|nr:hypothetical protein [Streptomyces sp. C10-9-1]MCQ6554766.1 hypothetical protein [Streptomyces sp. C10-9-1]
MLDLINAGAPPLPAGYFYRVQPADLGLLRVELRRQGRWFSSGVQDTYVRPGDYPTAEAAVVAGCQRVEQWWRERLANMRALDEARAWHGDHDPKGGR